MVSTLPIALNKMIELPHGLRVNGGAIDHALAIADGSDHAIGTLVDIEGGSSIGKHHERHVAGSNHLGRCGSNLCTRLLCWLALGAVTVPYRHIKSFGQQVVHVCLPHLAEADPTNLECRRHHPNDIAVLEDAQSAVCASVSPRGSSVPVIKSLRYTCTSTYYYAYVVQLD